MVNNKRDKKYSPDFIGIGAMRCGTTWIADKLRKHPDIYIPDNFKELHFFDQFYNKGIEWYENNFAKKSKDQIAGEFTPKYLRDENIAKLINKHYPKTKLIISIRDPLQRAFSHYNFLKKQKNLEAKFYESLFDKKYEILMAGLYGEQIQKYIDLFPKQNIHVIFFDDILKKPDEVVKNLYIFLGKDPHFKPSELSKAINKRAGVKFKSIQTLVPKIKQFLRQRILLRTLMGYIGVFYLLRFLSKLNTKKPNVVMDKRSKDFLKNYYKKDLSILEDIVDRKLSNWLK